MIFDLDGTLSPSKQGMQPEMAKTFAQLTRVLPIGVISGGSFEQFSRQLLTSIEPLNYEPQNLHLMPTCGTRYYLFQNDDWCTQYLLEMSPELVDKATKVIEEVARSLGYWCENPVGEIIEKPWFSADVFSSRGSKLTGKKKDAWDREGVKTGRKSRPRWERVCRN